MTLAPDADRYRKMKYNRVGRSGLMLPALSLGLWHNFGDDTPHDRKIAMCRTAFDLGITHFDLANNYGPPPGSAELAFGRILRSEFADLRDELVISTKAGHSMWGGPYGDWGSRKHLIASCDRSLKRLGLDCVDIFYSHRPDPVTPIEETCAALDHIVRSGRALYVGISAYDSLRSAAAMEIFRSLGTPCIINQPRYSMLDRWIEEDDLLTHLNKLGMGAIVYSPLAQGMLTSKYLNGVPEDSRAAGGRFLKSEFIRPSIIESIRNLNRIAAARGQSLAQMALAWVLKDERVTSALIGASRSSQILDCAKALENLSFCKDELEQIDLYSAGADIKLWKTGS